MSFKSILKIQCLYRGYRVRRLFKRALKIYHEIAAEIAAAINLRVPSYECQSRRFLEDKLSGVSMFRFPEESLEGNHKDASFKVEQLRKEAQWLEETLMKRIEVFSFTLSNRA
jgi:hypothetical protein